MGSNLFTRLIRAVYGFFRTWTVAVLRSVHNRGVVAEDSVRSSRMQICVKCPEYQYDFDMCSICFCKMTIKTSLIESECPLKKW